MKTKLLAGLLLLFLGNAAPVFSQIIVDGKNLNDLDTRYIEIIISRRAMTQDVQVMFDYGQQIDYNREFSQQIVNDSGKPIVFHSIVHALNIMDKNGWDFLTTYMAHTNNFERFHYLFRKRQKIDQAAAKKEKGS